MLKQLQPKRVTISEVEFAIYPFGAFTAARVSGDLFKVAGPVVAGLIPLISTDTEDGIERLLNSDLSKAVPAISAAFMSLDGEVLEKLLTELLIDYKNVACTYRDDNGAPVQAYLDKDLANQIFTQDMGGMIQLAIEVVTLNYKGFFNKLLTQYGSGVMGGQILKSGNTEDSTAPNLITLS